MALEWTRDRHVRNAPWVGASVGCSYRIYPTHEFAVVRVTYQHGRGPEQPLGVFPTLDAATRHVNAHYALSGLRARRRLAAQIQADREGVPA